MDSVILKKFLYAGYIAALFMVIFLGGSWVVAQLIIQVQLGSLFPDKNTFLVVGQGLIYVVLAVLFFVTARVLLKKKSIKDIFGLHEPTKYKYFLLVPLLFIVYAIVAGLLSALVKHLFAGFDIQQEQVTGFSFGSFDQKLIAGFMLVFLVPIFEEAVFRGWLFGFLRDKLGFWWVAVVVSAIFGYLHGQWNVAIDVFLLSLVLCWLREKTGSIWVGVSLHALKNLIAFMIIASGMV